MFKKLGLSLFALVAAAGIALAGGAFSGFPIVGDPGNDICLSFGNNGVCNQYSPAGPTNAPGGATFPADTNIQGAGANGNPATINVPLVLTGATTQDAAPLTGTTVVMGTGVSKLLLDPAGTLATLTINLPPLANGLVDGQEVQISATQTVSVLTLAPGTGVTIAGTAPTTVAPNTAVDLVYHAATAKWSVQ